MTRSPTIDRIFRVDPNKADKPRVIWTRADGVLGEEPKGIRGSSEQVSQCSDGTPRTEQETISTISDG